MEIPRTLTRKLGDTAFGVAILAAKGFAPAGVSTALEYLAKGRDLTLAIADESRNRAREIVAGARRSIEKDLSEWIKSEFRGSSRTDLKLIFDEFDRVFNKCIPTAGDLVASDLNIDKFVDVFVSRLTTESQVLLEVETTKRLLHEVFRRSFNKLIAEKTLATEIASLSFAKLIGVTKEIRADTAAVRETQRDHSHMLQELLRRVSVETGVPVAPLQAVLTRLGQNNVQPDDIANQLAGFADQYLELQDRLSGQSQHGPEVDKARQGAKDLIEGGDLAGAQAILSKSREQMRNVRRKTAEQEAMLLFDDAKIDLLNLEFDAAIAKFAEANTLVSKDSPEYFINRWQIGQSLALKGEFIHDRSSLLEALKIFDDLEQSRISKTLHFLQRRIAANRFVISKEMLQQDLRYDEINSLLPALRAVAQNSDLLPQDELELGLMILDETITAGWRTADKHQLELSLKGLEKLKARQKVIGGKTLELALTASQQGQEIGHDVGLKYESFIRIETKTAECLFALSEFDKDLGRVKAASAVCLECAEVVLKCNVPLDGGVIIELLEISERIALTNPNMNVDLSRECLRLSLNIPTFKMKTVASKARFRLLAATAKYLIAIIDNDEIGIQNAIASLRRSLDDKFITCNKLLVIHVHELLGDALLGMGRASESAEGITNARDHFKQALTVLMPINAASPISFGRMYNRIKAKADACAGHLTSH